MVLDLFRLNGKNALVTGSQAGLGRAMTIALAQAGANVMAHGRDRARLDAVCAEICAAGGRALSVEADLQDAGACARLIEATTTQLGSIDILINNAGIIRRKAAAEFSMQDWADIFEVNVTAAFRLCQLAGRQMLRQGSGKIINIASLLAFQGGILVPAYAASKGALAQLTKALANEWACKGINVNAIAPGYMATDNTAPLRADAVRSRQILERIPAGRWGVPEDLAGAAVFLASSASDYLNGHVLVVDGGWMAR